MLLKLYETLDSENVIGKTLTLIASIEIVIKQGFDISNPSINLVVEGFNPDLVNYCEIDLLGRKYFVRSVEKINNRIVCLHCECDVLETYKLDIYNSRSRYKRNIKTGDNVASVIDFSMLKTVTKVESDKGLTGDAVMILTTMGV